MIVDSIAGELLERSPELATLADGFDRACRGHGTVVLVGGESGVGKTALLGHFTAAAAARRVLWGRCERLSTPRALGPFVDVATHCSPTCRKLVESGAGPYGVLAAIADELRAHAPAILVLEDLHWADEATLDLFRLMAPRFDAVPALVLASYRDDELDPAHPLQVVLGDLAAVPSVVRVGLRPLSLAAVEALCEPLGADHDDVYAKTAGNPFYVTEVLATRTGGIPLTVRDAVLTRAAGLSAPARALLEAVAVIPSRTELWLLEAIVGGELAPLDECVARGMLSEHDGHVAFRHELARQAIEEATLPSRRLELHRAVLASLAHRGADPERLAHHAEAAGDHAAVLIHAPAAAARAAALGAHAVAASHYFSALRYAGELPLAQQADLFARRAYECMLTDQADAAATAFGDAATRYRTAGDRRAEGDNLAQRSRMLWFLGQTAEAETAAHAAVELLQALGESRELARAYGNVAHLAMLAQRGDAAIEWGERALVLAERTGDVAIRAQVLNTLGTAEWRAGVPGGRRRLERSLELARASELDEHVIRALLNIASNLMLERRYREARRYIDQGHEYGSRRELGSYGSVLLALRATCDLRSGASQRAADTARSLIEHGSNLPLIRVTALIVVGLLAVRRADPTAGAALDAARALASSEEPQQCGAVAAARAEAAWLDGRPEAIRDATDHAFALARERDDRWLLAELAFWRSRAGIRDDPAELGAEDPYALQLTGDWSAAAERWRELGCPYEAALAQLESEDEAELQAAVAQLRRLGATRAATKGSERLRMLGLRVPRGPRTATLANPAQLTARELEVACLLSDGLGNADIAQRLFISRKTVDHHVSAVLRKLGVQSRHHVGRAARQLGVL